MIRVPFERYQRDAAGIKFGQEIQSSRRVRVVEISIFSYIFQMYKSFLTMAKLFGSDE